MSFLSRLLGRKHDDRAHVRPLWHRVVEIAREPRWYAEYGVADTVAGRFDAITMVLALVILRMEREEALAEPSARLIELFVSDMDGQLRQSGVGDLVVGKKIGKLVSVLGGRMGALRDSLPQGDAAVAQAVARNVTLTDSGDAAKIASALIALEAQLAAVPADAILAASLPR